MMKISYLVERLQDVKLKDWLSIFPMFLALCLRPFYRFRYADTWLVCEEPAEARDNGYHFFRYMRQTHPDRHVLYAIKRRSVDYAKVRQLGSVIEYGSLRHWIVYFCCQFNISSNKGGKPNAAVCQFFELNGIFKVRNIFLQHGVIINDLRWLYADRSFIECFITSSVSETRYVEDRFGYPAGTIRMFGLSRFDALHEPRPERRRIVIMPTWRYWFNINSKKHSDTASDVAHSEYICRWRSLLSSPRLQALAEQYDFDVVFYPHHNIQPYLHLIGEVQPAVTVASWCDHDIQDVLKSAHLLITDYSSVFFDVVYMRRPVLFYQFDEEKYRKYQYGKGYFDYHDNPFGQWCDDENALLSLIEQSAQHDFAVSEAFLDAHKKEFPLYDTHNSERLYNHLATI